MKILQGIDLVKISRIEETIKRQGQRFLDKVFSPAEQDYCESKRMKFEHYAARFAAKEAVIKALKIDFKKRPALHRIEVKHEATGKPFVELSAAVRRAAAFSAEDKLELSLAHEREYAVATVVVLKKRD